MYQPNPLDIERLGMVSYTELSEAEAIMVLKRRGEIMTGQRMFTTSYGCYFFWKSGRAYEHPEYIEANTIGEAVNLYLKHFEPADLSASNYLFTLPKPRNHHG